MQQEKQQTQIIDFFFHSSISVEESLLTTQPLPWDCARFLPATLSFLPWDRAESPIGGRRARGSKKTRTSTWSNPKTPNSPWNRVEGQSAALFTVRFYFSSSAPQGEAALAAEICQRAQVAKRIKKKRQQRYASAPLLGEPSHVASVTAATHRMLCRLALVVVVEGSGGSWGRASPASPASLPASNK